MKRRIIILGSIILAAIFGVGYFNINKGVPKEYKIDEYNINTEVKLDKLSIKITDYLINKNKKEIDGNDDVRVVISMDVKNITDKNLNLNDLLQTQKLACGNYYQDYSEVEGNYDKVRNLNPNECIKLKLYFDLFKENIENNKNDEKLKYYMPKITYKNQIEKEFKDGKLYGKYILIGDLDEK